MCLLLDLSKLAFTSFLGLVCDNWQGKREIVVGTCRAWSYGQEFDVFRTWQQQGRKYFELFWVRPMPCNGRKAHPLFFVRSRRFCASCCRPGGKANIIQYLSLKTLKNYEDFLGRFGLVGLLGRLAIFWSLSTSLYSLRIVLSGHDVCNGFL